MTDLYSSSPKFLNNDSRSGTLAHIPRWIRTLGRTVAVGTISVALVGLTSSAHADVSAGAATTAAPACETTVVAPKSTEADAAGWSYHESLAGGHQEYVADGLHVWTDGDDLSQAKSAGYVATNLPLSTIGEPVFDYTLTSGAAPGVNYMVFVDGAWFGNLVKEPLFDQWWARKPVGDLPAGPNSSYQKAYGTLAEFSQAWADSGTADVVVRAVGFSLGSGAIGDATIHSLTAACTRYDFGRAPEPIAVVPVEPTWSQACGPDNDSWTLPAAAEGYTWEVRKNVDGSVTADARAATGYVFSPGARTSWTGTDTNVPCAPSSDDLAPDLKDAVQASGDARPGASLVVHVGREYAGMTVDVVIFSAPTPLGKHVVSAQGDVTVALPTTFPAGDHSLAVYSADGVTIGWTPVTVSPAGPPSTDPTTPPTTTSPSAPETSPSALPSTEPSPAATAADGASGGELAATGVPLALLALSVASLIGLGAALVLRRRRV